MQPIPLDLTAAPLDTFLWLGLAIAILVFGIYSAILLWHWKEYSTGKFTTVTNMFTYVAVGGGLLVVMALSSLWYGM